MLAVTSDELIVKEDFFSKFVVTKIISLYATKKENALGTEKNTEFCIES